eukprot:587993-Hanusia_phi.AAC.1
MATVTQWLVPAPGSGTVRPGPGSTVNGRDPVRGLTGPGPGPRQLRSLGPPGPARHPCDPVRSASGRQ